MKHIYLLFSVLLFSLLVGCTDDPDISGEVHNALPPTVKTGEPKDPTASTVEISGEVVQENGSKVTEYGFIWGKMSPLTFDNKEGKDSIGEGKGEFSTKVEHLKDSSTYFIRAYAINAKGISLGEEKTFPTCSGLGLVRTFVLSDSIRSKSAIAGGVILGKGGATITKRGIYYAKSKEILVSLQKDSVVSVMETDSFVCKLTQLDSITTYYVQAFVVNEFGLSLGKVDSLKTTDGKPIVGAVERVSVGYTEARLKATVNAEGDSAVTLRGFCYGTSTNLSIDRNDTIHCGDGIGEFSGLLAHLQSEKQYYVKAFAINSLGVSYSSNSFAFTTLSDKPTVSTSPNTELESVGSIKVSGELVGQGSSSVSVVGFCWGTSANPTIESNDTINVSFDGIGNFEGLLTGLKGGRTYYIRAFAQNEDYLTYGENVTYTTPNIFINKPNFSSSSRTNTMAVFTIGNTGYLLGGKVGSTYTDELWKYDALYDKEWEAGWSFAGGPREYQTAFGFSGYAYVFGGKGNGYAFSNDLYKYTASTNAWTAVTSTNPPDSLYGSSAVVLNNIGYLIGGCRDTITNEVWTFNPSNLTWEPKDSLPARQYRSVVAVIDNVIYAGLGLETVDGLTSSKQIWYSNNGTSWTAGAPMPGGNARGGVAFDGSLYVIDDTGTIWRYKANVWTKKSQLPGVEKDVKCMFVLNNQIYIGYGRNSFVTYDPTWDL